MFELYAEVRATEDPRKAWSLWTTERDALFRDHPSTPLPEGTRKGFSGIGYFPHDPAARTTAEVVAADPEHYDIATSGETTMGFTRFGLARFELFGERIQLELYWLDGYGGGLFLPFRDATAGAETYGAGRYLLDTVKGADLGAAGDRLILDFNFAYNPSCSYDDRWVCPLAPPPNQLPIAIRAGERTET